jgi:hypothetical protein
MKELKHGYKGLTADMRKLGDSHLTTLKTKIAFSVDKSIEYDGKTLFVTKIYKENETYDVIYALIGANGEADGFFHEQEGIMPTLFNSKSGNGWFVVENDKMKEIFVETDEPGYRELQSDVFLELGRNDLMLGCDQQDARRLCAHTRTHDQRRGSVGGVCLEPVELRNAE